MADGMTNPAAPASPGERPRPSPGYPMVLQGQPALVTGANSGIGKAVALGLGESGADVVVNYVTNPQAAEEVAHQIEAGGRRAIAIKADVSKEDEVKAMFAKGIDHFHIAAEIITTQIDRSQGFARELQKFGNDAHTFRALV